ncbi:MAG: c-type cytochrome [Chitinophagaceae bacterium]|jgi:mono/diheme cytochrome c family protein
MKQLFIISSLALGIGLVSCNGVQRKPSKVYMPDMAYSRAYETYADRDSLFTTNEAERGNKIFYNNMPAKGTIARGSEMPFPLAQDKAGDTTNYYASKAVKSPIDTMTAAQLEEAGRLYLINCGICHGTKLDGNGPLYKGGEGPYAAKPATLVGDVKYETMPEGQMFYSIAYGKGQMGSYASQLTRKQRWEVIAYIKHKQKAAKATAAPAADATGKK